MKSLKVKKIDGLDVVVGFQDRVICPVSTQSKNRQAVHDTVEFKELKKLNKKQDDYNGQMLAAGKKAGALLKASKDENVDPVLAKKYVAQSAKQDKIKTNLGGMLGTLNEEAKPLVLACRKKEIEILTDNPVYNDEVIDPVGEKAAGPRQGEMIKTAGEIEDLKQKLADKVENMQLLENGEYVNDERGKVYCLKMDGKWVKKSIDKLVVTNPSGSKFESELTDSEKIEIGDQEHTDRLAAMTQQERQDEYELMEEGTAERAYDMRGKLEIRGTSAADALAQSQEFYNSELAKLKLEYGVE